MDRAILVANLAHKGKYVRRIQFEVMEGVVCFWGHSRRDTGFKQYENRGVEEERGRDQLERYLRSLSFFDRQNC